MKRRFFFFLDKNSTDAFTLNELLVSTAILGILAVIAVPSVQDALLKAKIASTQNNLRIISDAIDVFSADRGYYPPGSSEPPMQFVTNYDALEALRPLIGVYLPHDCNLLLDPFTKNAARSINESIALELSDLPDIFGYGYYDYTHFMVPPRKPIRGYGIVSFGPDNKDSSLGLRPLPGIGSLIESACYQPSNGLRSEGDIGRFGGHLSFPTHIP